MSFFTRLHGSTTWRNTAVGVAIVTVGTSLAIAVGIGTASAQGATLANGFEGQAPGTAVTAANSARSGDRFDAVVGGRAVTYDANGARGVREIKIEGGTAYVQWNVSTAKTTCARFSIWVEQAPAQDQALAVLRSDDGATVAATWKASGALGLNAGGTFRPLSQKLALHSWDTIEVCAGAASATLSASSEHLGDGGRLTVPTGLPKGVTTVRLGSVSAGSNPPFWMDELRVRRSGRAGTPSTSPSTTKVTPTTKKPGTTTSTVKATTTTKVTPTTKPTTTTKKPASSTTSTAPSPSGSTPPIAGNWRLAFSDDFNGTAVDRSKWADSSSAEADQGHGNKGNKQLEWNQAANCTVGSGALTMTAKREQHGSYDWTSCLLTTTPSYSFRYGYIEERSILPSARGFWPAFWTWQAPGINQWVETDVYEFYSDNHSALYLTQHSGSGGGCNVSPSFDPSSGWHTYGADIQADGTTWYLDGKQVCHTAATHTANANIITNLAVFADVQAAAGTTSATKKVDYVRAWQR